MASLNMRNEGIMGSCRFEVVCWTDARVSEGSGECGMSMAEKQRTDSGQR